jgi:hypothetical protein
VQEPGATTFTPAVPDEPLRPGTLVNVSGSTALPIKQTDGRTMTFYGVPDGVPSQFRIVSTPPTGSAGLITVQLIGGNFSKKACGTTTKGRKLSAEAKTKKPVRRLWGSGKGKYTTKGKYASATVRGTNWLVSDYCGYSTVTVKTGSVLVHNIVTGKNVIVNAGHSYTTQKKP